MRKLIVILALACPLFAATEPNPTPKQRELIEKMLVLMNADASTHAVMDAMLGQMEKELLGESDDESEAREAFKMFRDRAMKIDLGKDLREAQIRLYSKYFTEKELADLVAFYTSPTGKKMIDTMPQLMRESVTIGADLVGPKLQKITNEVREEQEKARPWRKTMADIRTIATAVEAYATDENAFPTGDINAIEKVLVPTYIKKMPQKDMWGHAYGYAVSPDRQHYRIASAGADANFEWDSLRITPVKIAGGDEAEVNYRDRLEDDIVYADGHFLQLPVQAKPKDKD